MSDYKSNYLQEVLESYNMTHIDDLLNAHKQKRTEIAEFLQKTYGSDIYGAFNSGSYAKHTAINSKFDLDVVIPFKRGSFNTLEDMFNDIYKKLHEEYNETAVYVRPQGVSVGLQFNENDLEINIDIVPARETSKDDYPESKNLNIHITDGDKNYLKTNIHSQIEHIKAKTNERKTIKLLKVWKTSQSQKYKSFFLELIVIKAFEQTSPTGNLWNQLETVLLYISDNVTDENFKLIDPGNSNNDLMDTLDKIQRLNLSNHLKNIVLNVTSNEEHIKLYFPKNEEFTSGDKAYGLKSASASAFSLPPSSQRFG